MCGRNNRAWEQGKVRSTWKRWKTRWSGTEERSERRWMWRTAVARVKRRRDGGGDIQTDRHTET